jgi:nitroreductase
VTASPEASYRLRYGSEPTLGPPARWTDVLAQQLSHRSVSSYRPDPVSDETLAALIAAAQSAPTSGNLQLWSVVAVRDDERRTRLAHLARDQKFIVEAAVLSFVDVALAAQNASLAEPSTPRRACRAAGRNE